MFKELIEILPLIIYFSNYAYITRDIKSLIEIKTVVCLDSDREATGYSFHRRKHAWRRATCQQQQAMIAPLASKLVA